MSWLDRQFGRPSGLAGRLVGALMAHSNRELNAWTVELLGVKDGERVLEVGFGPGIGVEHLARTSRAAFIAGVDHSPLMVQQARRRNAAFVQEGRVELRWASVSALPFGDSSFDKAFCVNSIQFWPDPQDNLREVQRVLRPGGLVAVTLQPRWAEAESTVAGVGQQLVALVAGAGFADVRLASRSMRPVGALCATGVRPPT
ncbi:class I SAM-dependent methyltransferase [Carboxydochorda subterranea]|uniref:Class I SAM-dependent methyltransferase n=1 Tax=Carboxydichorda subterranea TaxID=3109565 RepID=A0ABZ1BXH6_9FIRM|nr:class I SAM-dependent methyltransferase [Limnochorda sp. L945t]WRP17399.1 class I SAM-dependent methyltransferase [Limnochorda sp. L945t]